MGPCLDCWVSYKGCNLSLQSIKLLLLCSAKIDAGCTFCFFQKELKGSCLKSDRAGIKSLSESLNKVRDCHFAVGPLGTKYF